MKTEHFRTGDGCTIGYQFDGEEAAPILLLSNSLGTTREMWEPQMAAFTRSFRVLRYDSRGHGASQSPAGGYSIDRLGQDVVELLDWLSIDAVNFCGLSLGGMIGQWLGIVAPERLRRLVLANTSSHMGPPSGWDSRISMVMAEGMAPVAQASVERWFTPEFTKGSPDAIAPLSETLHSLSPVGYAGCCAAIRDMDMRRTSSRIDLPTLIISGTQDPATPPAHSVALLIAIANSQHVMLEAAHLSNVEQPAAFGAAVKAFLTM